MIKAFYTIRTLSLVWLFSSGTVTALSAPAEAQPPAIAAPTAAAVAAETPDVVEQSHTLAEQNCTIAVYTKDAVPAKVAIAKAFAEMQRIYDKLDASNKHSELAAINANAPADEVIVTEETLGLLQLSLDICRRSGGAFDPTVSSYDYLWNFKGKPFVKPLPEEVAARRAIAGCKHVALKLNRAVRLMQPTARVSFRDLLGGYAVQRALESLRASGFESMKIVFGNDVYVLGRQGTTRHWYATLVNPHNANDVISQLYLTSHFTATRTDMESFVYKNNKRYCGIVDPRSGQPVEGVVQATVIATDPLLADALSSAVFALGPKAGLALMAKEKNVEGFVIDAAGKVFASPRMGDFARLPAKIALEKVN